MRRKRFLKIKRLHWRHIGMRNVKTAVSVLLCLVIYQIWGRDGVMLACIAAILSMQGTLEKSFFTGLYRVIGTVIGGVFGGAFLTLSNMTLGGKLYMLYAAVGVVLIIYLETLIDRPESVSISCIVFLIIMVDLEQQGALSYAFNRTVDTLVGIACALIVNLLIKPPRSELKEENQEDELPQGPAAVLPPETQQMGAEQPDCTAEEQ